MSYPDLWDLVIFVGVPLAVVGLIFALVYLPGGSAKRYRPGRPYNFAPVWFMARPEQSAPSAGALAELEQAGASHDYASEGRRHPTAGDTGGASDKW